MKELGDEELVRKVVDEKDRDAFSELIERYKGGVFALLHRLLGPSEEMEDIAQNIFLAAYRGLPMFRGQAKFGTWIYRIAYNQACTALRRIASRRGREEPLDSGEKSAPEPAVPDPGAVNPEEAVLHSEVWRAVQKLPTSLRAVVELHHGRGLRYPEIAEVLSLPLGTVKTHLHRARAQLRELLVTEK